ncbi:MAG TPA: branched-chain amino acid ABC transporter permease [Xanthobacteraceae bacterium]|jgi:branched-chain amino acid transport system permease protein|nr:branched-chain amino acid ABC transporter permease [Xanthobacteraceae bacterium]
MRRLLHTAFKPQLFLLLAAGLLLTIVVRENRFFAFVAGITMISIMWAAGMNLLTGYAGLVSLAFAGIAGISAYTTVGLVMRLGWSFWLAMPVAALGAAAVGVLLGLPSLRLKGFYFALSSLVIQTVLSLGFVYFVNLTNGDTGISQIPPPDIPFTGAVLRGTSFDLLLTFAAWFSLVAVWAIVHSPFGRRLIAIREDEVLAEAIGIDVVRNKMLVFFVGSLFAGVGGALYATYVGFASPRSFDLLSSLSIWLMVAFGGRGTLMGPVVGALILAPVPFLLQQYDTLKDVIYGALIIAVIVLLPGGIYGALVSFARSLPLLRRLSTPYKKSVPHDRSVHGA